MDPFHQRLARVALGAAARFGFCLAGGYAVQAHGFVDRMSKDVDLFTTMTAASDFPAAVAAVAAALRADDLDMTVEREGPSFARLSVTDVETASTSTVELGIDWRAYPPVQLAIGPVLHPADAVANKLCALFGRAEVRDYIDVYGVLRDGRYSGSEMLRLAADHDPGFDRQVFAEALRAVRRFPDSAFDPYRLSPDEIVTLCNHLLAWADEITCLNQ
ncbi:nucleotidyl transferase AbiEii/AbiGii toxin family protein [Solwaraspora sp. WMMB762]|uniref:nucleotidyl transferase AbiEii/AbiGii toxin family protein n=1 Tax=Solwaraspora sp. WMMB762 TaxID=3404120 RepID=UPI003B94EB50